MARLQTLKPQVKTLQAPIAEASPTERMRGSALQRVRADMMQANPLCAWCEKRGIVREGVICDHVIPLAEGGPDIPSNRQLLCHECNRAKTLEDLRRQNGRGA